MNQLGHSPNKTNGGKSRQEEIPQCHATSPIPRFLVSKVAPTVSNSNAIQGHCQYGNPRIVDHPIAKWYWVIIQFKIEVNASKEVGVQTGEIFEGNPRQVLSDAGSILTDRKPSHDELSEYALLFLGLTLHLHTSKRRVATGN